MTLLIWGYITSSLIVLLLIYHAGEATMNMEKFFYPFAVICVLSICFIGYKIKYRNVFIVLILIFGNILAVKSITKESNFYTHRLENIQKLETIYFEKQNFKTMLADSLLPVNEFGSIWGLPYETMLVSALKNRKNSVTVKAGSPKELKMDSFFLVAGFELPRKVSKLNPEYFHLPISSYYIDTLNYFKK